MLGPGLAAAALIAVGPAPASAHVAPHSCRLKGSATIHQLAQVRVYRFHGRVYGCSKRYGKRVLVAKAGDRVGCFTDVYTQSNETVLAVARDASPFYARLTSWSLKDGKRLRAYTYTYDSPGCGSVYELVTNSRGSLAWIGLSTEHENGSTEVDTDDSSGFAMLDYEAPALCDPMMGGCGDAIDTSYLTASGGMVFWKSNGALKSAPFS